MNNKMEKTQTGQWNPFRDLDNMRRELESMWAKPFMYSPDLAVSSQAKQWMTAPMADFDETPTHYLISVDLPGVSKEQVKVEVHENDLRVFGERKEEKRDSSNHVTERFVGKFERRFGFPTPVDASKIEAAYEDGVLRIAAPKAGGTQSRQIRIGDSTGDSSALKKVFGSKSNKT